MQKIGLLLLLIGAGTAVGFLIYWFVWPLILFMPWPARIAIAGGAVGGILILASLIRERIKRAKKEEEKFKGVDH
jgi:uncharacterized integral membrane protein